MVFKKGNKYRFLKGHKNCFSEETKKNISKSNKGKHSKPTLGRFQKGHKVWCEGKHLSEEHKRKIGSANTNPNSVSKTTGRKRAQKLFPCPEDKERHHIDGNPLNNDPSNVQIVTPKEHMVIDGRIKFHTFRWNHKTDGIQQKEAQQ